MRTFQPWQLIVLAALTSAVCFALVRGIKYENAVGIWAAVGSAGALILCFRLMVRMNEMREEDYEEEY